MTQHAFYRFAPVAVMAVALAVPGAGQTAVGGLLGELSRYLGAAARFTSDAVLGVRQLEASQVTDADRAKIRAELDAITRSLTALSAAKEVLVANLSDYADRVRREGFRPERDGPRWRATMQQVTKVSGMVDTALTILERNSTSLRVALSPDDRVTLRKSLEGRKSLFAQLAELTPPSTPAELDQLDTMNKVYGRLIQSLNDLNVALNGAIDRLSAM